MKASKKLRGHALGLLGLLIAQYALGMLTNLLVTFPEHNTDWQQWDYANSQLLVMAHIAVGILLLFGMVVLLLRAIRLHDKSWKISAGLGLGSILLAIITGSEFISTQAELYSFAMSLLFIVAVASVGWGIYKTKD